MEILNGVEYTYIYAGGEPIAIHKKISPTSSEIFYLHLDHQGSLMAISDASGSIVEQRSEVYPAPCGNAWGRPRNPSTWTYLLPNPFGSGSITMRGYTMHEHLDMFSLINMNGRLYDPVLCRMLSPDPFIQSPDNTQNYNRYSYCWNNPLKYTDPSGEIITWNIGNGGGSLGFNLTPFGIPLGGGINIGWGNGFSAGVYGEVGYRAGGTGFGKGATVSQSLDYNFNQADLSTTSSASAYTSFGAFNAGVSYSKTYSFETKQWSNGNWSVSGGLGVGTARSGLGLNVSYGSGGWGYGMGGYHDKTAPSQYTKTIETEVTNEEIVSACEGCPPEQKRKEAASSLAGVAVVALAEPSFFGEVALAVYGSYLIMVYGPEIVRDAFTNTSSGNHKHDADYVQRLREKQNNGTISGAEKMKLIQHDKATKNRPSRATKDNRKR